MNKDINMSLTSLGIELGSTRIKAILIDQKGNVLASGTYDWENQYVDGIWTYDLDMVWLGIQQAYLEIKKEIYNQYNIEITNLGSIGFSAMMHGYLAFDENDKLLVPFRTWRNAITAAAEKELTLYLEHNIPQRWSIAHYYQAILNKEKHVKDVAFFTTLAGYVHWQLTGRKVIGINDASGIFPIDPSTKDYDQKRITLVNNKLKEQSMNVDVKQFMPEVLIAGDFAGVLSEKGALLLDPSGSLKHGIPFAPPEGDAGTGMIATHAIAPNTGNLSAGTSVFAMIVLEKELSRVYPEIDIVTTPLGDPVAMVHVNNCTSEINAWVDLFKDFSEVMGFSVDSSELYTRLFKQALKSDDSLNGILSYGYHSGENITHLSEGRPLLVRTPDAKFNVANLMRSQIDSAFATLSIGMRILFDEGLALDSIVGHGGIFKTETVAQFIAASAVETPITLMKTASEGGAWGMAVLAAYMLEENRTLIEYLDEVIFDDVKTITIKPSEKDINQYRAYLARYIKGLEIEREAVQSL